MHRLREQKAAASQKSSKTLVPEAQNVASPPKKRRANILGQDTPSDRSKRRQKTVDAATNSSGATATRLGNSSGSRGTTPTRSNTSWGSAATGNPLQLPGLWASYPSAAQLRQAEQSSVELYEQRLHFQRLLAQEVARQFVARGFNSSALAPSSVTGATPTTGRLDQSNLLARPNFAQFNTLGRRPEHANLAQLLSQQNLAQHFANRNLTTDALSAPTGRPDESNLSASLNLAQLRTMEDGVGPRSQSNAGPASESLDTISNLERNSRGGPENTSDSKPPSGSNPITMTLDEFKTLIKFRMLAKTGDWSSEGGDS